MKSVTRFFDPVPIHFEEAIPIAFLGLAVNIASAWLLSGADHGHSYGHAHGVGEGHHHDDQEEMRRIATDSGVAVLEIFEDGVPPRFRLRAEPGLSLTAENSAIETIRPDGTHQHFALTDRGGYLESIDEITEPHAFTAHVRLAGEHHTVVFEKHEHAHASAHRDNNMRAAVIHVIADATVSVLVIIALLLARAFAWVWTDPAAGIIGSLVIASWSYALIRDTGGILLDMNPDQRMADNLRQTIEADGDRLADLHLWRLGPGHLGAIVCVGTHESRGPNFYRAKLSRFRTLSHLTIEVRAL